MKDPIYIYVNCAIHKFNTPSLAVGNHLVFWFLKPGHVELQAVIRVQRERKIIVNQAP